jgi:hypothetical protein
VKAAYTQRRKTPLKKTQKSVNVALSTTRFGPKTERLLKMPAVDERRRE